MNAAEVRRGVIQELEHLDLTPDAWRRVSEGACGTCGSLLDGGPLRPNPQYGYCFKCDLHWSATATDASFMRIGEPARVEFAYFLRVMTYGDVYRVSVFHEADMRGAPRGQLV